MVICCPFPFRRRPGTTGMTRESQARHAKHALAWQSAQIGRAGQQPGARRAFPQSPPQRPRCSRRIPFTPAAVPLTRYKTGLRVAPSPNICLAGMNKDKTCQERQFKRNLGSKIEKTLPNRCFRGQSDMNKGKICQHLLPQETDNGSLDVPERGKHIPVARITPFRATD